MNLELHEVLQAVSVAAKGHRCLVLSLEAEMDMDGATGWIEAVKGFSEVELAKRHFDGEARKRTTWLNQPHDNGKKWVAIGEEWFWGWPSLELGPIPATDSSPVIGTAGVVCKKGLRIAQDLGHPYHPDWSVFATKWFGWAVIDCDSGDPSRK